jgi:ferredoxin
MDDAGNGLQVAGVNKQKCIGCGVCAPACPGGSLTMSRRSVLHVPPADKTEQLMRIAREKGKLIAVDAASASVDLLSPALPLSFVSGLPETFRDAITGQAAVFNPVAAGDLCADMQFCVTGQEPGEYVLRIADGCCAAHTGKVSNPALTVHTPSEVWLQIARGELSGQTAFMQGLYRAEGNMMLLMRMNELFSGAK